MTPISTFSARNAVLFRAFFLVLAAVRSLIGCPQAVADESAPTISVDVRLVVLHASVRDRKGAIASELRQSNFQVEEDGVAQTIRAFQPEDMPVAVGLVVDNSGSMRGKKSDVAAAAVEFARSSNPQDDMFIVNFNEYATLGLSDRKLFSSSVAELESALLRPVPAGKTALYDALVVALRHLQNSNKERKALLVISDGGDNASNHTLHQVLQEIQQSNVTVYTIGLFTDEDPDRNSGVLRRIAKASGGEAFLPRATSESVQICQRIARDIRGQYTIGYSPTNAQFAGEYRAIKVTVIGDHGERFQVRTRPGYIALPARAIPAGGR